MKGTILQPTYLPWIGYFDMIDIADIYVVFDDVQFSKKSWQHWVSCRALGIKKWQCWVSCLVFSSTTPQLSKSPSVFQPTTPNIAMSLSLYSIPS